MTIQSLELLRIGVLIPEEVQLLDLATVDLLSMLSKDYLTRAKLPAPLINLGVAEVKIHYIAESKTEPHQTTTAGAIQLTHSIDDKEVQPGELDIIHIPGPFLPPTISDKFKAFVQAHRDYRFAPDKSNKEGRKVDFLVVCTGIFVAGICGILDGKQVTGPRMALFDLQLMFPTASSWDWDRRWKHDGNVWTCGTICNGLDMIAAYMLDKYPRALVEPILFISQTPERGQKYENTKIGAGLVRNFWWMSSWMLNALGIKFV